MKTVKQLLSTFLNQPGEYNFDSLVEIQSHLKELASNAPTIIQINEVSKYCVSGSDVSSAGSDLMASLGDLLYGDIGHQYWTPETPDEPSRFIIDISKSDDLEDVLQSGFPYLIAYYSGFSLSDEATWDEFSSNLVAATNQVRTVATVSGLPIQYSKTGGTFNFSVLDKAANAYTTFLKGVVTPTSLRLEPVYFGVPLGDSGVVSFESIAADLLNTWADNACLSDILSNLTYYGDMTKERLTSILNTFGNCEAAQFIQDSVGLIKDGGYVNVFSIVVNYIQNTMGNHDEDSEYYNPVVSPSFVTSIIAVVATALIAVISVVLSVVFKALGAVISAVLSVLSSLISWLSSSIAGTKFKLAATGPQLLPTWNLPVFTKTDILLPASSAYLYDGALQGMEEYGCCALIPDTNPSFCVINAKSNNDQCFMQILPLAFKADGSKFGYGNFGAEYKVAEGVSSVTIHTCFGHGNQYWDGTVDVSDSWMSMSDEEARRAWTQLILSLFWFSSLADSQLDAKDTSITVTTDQWDMLKALRFNDFYSSVLTSQPTTSPELLFRIMYLYLTSIKPDQFVSAYSPSTSPIQVYHTAAELDCYTGGENRSGMAWTNIRKVLDGTGGLWKILVNNYFNGSTAAVTPGHDYSVAPGAAALTPSVEFPDVSKSALLTAALVAAVTAVAVTAVTITVKRSRRSKAVSRLSEREAAFSAAQTAYKANPSKENAKNLCRANRRLTRAWTRAGKVGLSSYNGFSTSTSPAAAPATELSKLKDLYEAHGTLTDSISLDDLTALIRGV